MRNTLAFVLAGFLFASSAFAESVKVTGTVSGIEAQDNDGFVDGALVLPSLNAEALLQFNVENLLAPSETMQAGPKQVNVPGNLFFPSQVEIF